MAAITRDGVSSLRAFFRALFTPLNLSVLAILVGIGIAGSIRSAWTFNTGNNAWWESFLQNFSTEMFGAFLTFLLIEVVVSNRRAREATEREDEAEKAALILQMGSPDNAFAIEAVRQLRARGWLQDGSLQGAVLREANLQRADLPGANLQEADLSIANLQEAELWKAKLQEATLTAANLKEASLHEVNLQGAGLWRANLQGAALWRANLQGAALKGANLQGARLEAEHEFISKAEFNEETSLPDGTKWTPNTDMARFTDPDHPEFWRSDAPDSPAYRGDDDDDNGDD